jgi:hypothetical protein
MRTTEVIADPVATGVEMNDMMKAYDTFGNAAKERALKVILTNPVKP